MEHEKIRPILSWKEEASLAEALAKLVKDAHGAYLFDCDAAMRIIGEADVACFLDELNCDDSFLAEVINIIKRSDVNVSCLETQVAHIISKSNLDDTVVSFAISFMREHVALVAIYIAKLFNA